MLSSGLRSPLQRVDIEHSYLIVAAAAAATATVGNQPQVQHELYYRPTKANQLCKNPSKTGHKHCHLHGRKATNGRPARDPACCDFPNADAVAKGSAYKDGDYRGAIEGGAIEDNINENEEAREQSQHAPTLYNRPRANGEPCQISRKRGHRHCQHHGSRNKAGIVAEPPGCCDFTEMASVNRDLQEADENINKRAVEEQLEHVQTRLDNTLVSYSSPV